MKKTLLFLLFPLFLQAQSLDWQIPDVTFNQGDTVPADFYAYGFDSITAYQFAMLFDTGALAFVGVTFPPVNPMGLSDGCFSWHGKPGYNIKPGELRHARSMPYSKTFADGTHGFSYVFVAKQAGTLSQKLTLSTCCLYPPLNPISYRWVLVPQSLSVSYIEPAETTATDAPLFQVGVFPNPTAHGITIQTTEPVDVQIFDFNGRLTHAGNVEDTCVFWALNEGINIVFITNGRETYFETVIKN